MTANAVAGAYNSIGEAFQEGVKRFGTGNFALQTCLPGERAYRQFLANLFISLI
jgi:hypothetical protein